MALADTQETAGPWSDYAAPVATAASNGPWSDYGAAKPSATPANAAVANQPALDYAHPAGLNGPAPQLPAHPAVTMGGGAAMTPDLEKQVDQSQAQQVQKFSQPGKIIGNEIVSGAQDLGQSAAMDFENSGGNPLAPNLTGDAAKQRTNLALGGAAKLIAGGGTALLALDAPQILEIGSSALAGDVTARVAMAKIAAGVAAGTGASAAGGAAADKLNLSPQAKSLVQSVAFFLPSLFGAAAGVKTGVGTDVEGNPAAGASAFGGKVRAGGVATPEAYDLRAQVGDTRVGVKIPRPQPAPDPARIFEAQQNEAGTNAVVRAGQKAQQAQQVVAGGPPPPPPGPALPDALKNGVISPETAGNIAQAIYIAPVEQHPQLLMEAHGKLTEYIQKQGRIIGPDGKLQIAETPQQAAKLAQNIINDEVDRQSQARTDLAKQQADAVKQQQAEAEKARADAQKPNADGVTAQDRQFQRAKTIIEGTTPKPGQHLDETLMRNLNVDRPAAHALVDRYVKEKGAEQLPTVGSKAEPVVEESRATVDAQMGALKRGDIGVVMLPEGSKYRPAVPAGMKLMAVRGEAPGAGMYIYDPAKVQAATIREAAKNGTHGDLLGHVQPKAELDPAKPTVVVQARGADGTTIQDSEVHPERVAAQAQSLQERHPDANVVVKPTHQVMAERLAEEDHPANDYLERKGGRDKSPEPAAAAGTYEPAAASEKELGVPPAEKRTDLARRKAVEEMTPEEMRRELLTSHTVDLPNRRAFEEAQAKEPAKAVAMSDADGLKALNDRFGYEAGNALLKAKADALKQAGLEAYHDKGDEFLYRGASRAEIAKKLEAAREMLRERIIDAKTTDGRVVSFKGADFSHGTGEDLHGAESRLKEHKADREARGERARGELRGITEVGPEGRGVDHGQAAKEVAEPENPPAADGGRTGATNRAESASPADQEADVEKSLAEKKPSAPAKGDRVAFKDRDGIEREGVIRHAGERITRIGKYDVANSKVGEARPELKPGQDGRVAVSELHLDPKRFQYKVSNIGAEGVSDLLTGKKWNDKLSGAISAWRDPADGKMYVVNGHHRVTLAKQTKTPNLLVRLLDEPTAADARATGALQNIADGRGSAIDAAKFFRDSGMTVEKLEEEGISMGEATAQNGVALSRLDTRLFDMVVQGKMSQGRGIAIGRETADAATQDAVLKLIEQAERRGVKVNDGTVEELARFAQTAPQRQETVASLFGDQERTTSTAIDKAMVSAYVKRQMGAEKRAFSAVSTEARAKALSADGKNQIDAEGNKAKATSAEQALEVYDKLSARRGAINDILNRAAEERADAKPAEVSAIDQRAYEDIRAAVSETLAGRNDAGIAGVQAASGPSLAELERAGQSGFFARRNPNHPVESLALPGMGGDIEKQNESAAETRAELQRENVERSLTTAKGDVSNAAGEMERNSPLFFGTSASGQDTLFDHPRRELPASVARQLDEAFHRTTGQNLARASYRRLSFDGGRPYLELDADGYYAFNRLIGQKDDYLGMLLGNADTAAVRRELEHQASQSSGVSTQHVERMATAFSGASNEYGHTILAAPGANVWTLLEENQHSWAVRFDLHDSLVHQFSAGSFLEDARAELKRAGYDDRDNFLVVAESVAKAASNPNFLPVEQRRAILERYTALLKEHGVDLTYVPSTLDDVRDVYQGAGNVRYKAQPGDTDQAAYQAIRGLSETRGRQGDVGDSSGGSEAEGGGQAAVQQPDTAGTRGRDEVAAPGTAKLDPEVTQKIRAVVEAAKAPGHAPQKAVIGPAEGWLVRAAKEHGYNFEGFSHVVDGSAIRHIFNRHGDVKLEDRRGNIAVTEKDLDAIPAIVSSPDRVVLGAKTAGHKDIVGYLKRMSDGTTVYLEEVRSGRSELATVSMRRYPAARDLDAIAGNVPSYARSDGGNVPIILAPPWERTGTSTPSDEAKPLLPVAKASEKSVAKTEEGETKYLHGGLGIAAGALKPLSQIKPVADIAAFLGDEADRVAVSRDLHNRLYDLASQDNAAVLRVMQMMEAMPGTAKDQQAIYHHLEDPKGVTLTDAQQEILDGYLTPLIYQAEHDFQVITEGGVPLERYVHRQVRDRGGMIDRLLDKAKDKTPASGIGGGRLTKTAPGQKHRTMMAVEDVKTGQRQVVSIKGGRVAVMKNGQAPRDIGELRSGLTTVGAEVDARMLPFVQRVTELRDEIAGAKDADRDEQLAGVQAKIAELRKQQQTLEGIGVTVGRSKPDLFQKGAAIKSNEVTFGKRAEISKQLEPLLKKEEALKAGTAPMLLKNTGKLNRRKEDLKDAEAARDHFLNELPPETFADKAWKSKDGDLYKITQATTKEIEANTNVRYYQNAAGSVAVNYLAMDKARRAYEFLEDFKKSPEFAAGSHSLNSPGTIPKGWQATQLPQFRGYFFEPHIAEVLDSYAAKAAHDPSVLEKVGNFLRASIFFNPLIHIPNLLNHWAVEKGVSGFANPLNYPTMTRAGIKAINAVVHQNADFLEALDHGAPLQSQQFEMKQMADLFFKRMQDELGDPESSKAKELAAALGMSPVRLVKAIYDFSGKATWYTNDIAFLQAAYEKQERGMALKAALTETAKHIPDYRLMTRIFDNPQLATVMSNRNLTMFGAYHYGALKSYGQMTKSLTGFNWTDAGTKNDQGEPTNAAGRTEGEEKRHGLDQLAMLAVITSLVYPLLDKLVRMVTGNEHAQMRRAGASTLLYNLAMLAKGEKTPEELAESIATPAVQTKAAAEFLFNLDIRTGQRLRDPTAPLETRLRQGGRQLLRAVAPVSQGLDLYQGRTDWKRLMYSMVGVSFPVHGAEKIAAMITAEKLASLPPKSDEDVARAIQRSRALHDFWAGDRTKLDALLHGKDFTPKEKMKIRKDSLMPPIVYAVKNMQYADAMKVYHAATPEQKRQLRPSLNKKLARLVSEGKKPEAEDTLGKDDDN